jgi:beta-glucosidase
MPKPRDGNRPLLPDGFRFGVATSAFQTEGGLNGPGEPENNWAAWERSARVEPSGLAVDFWNRWQQQLDRAAALACDTFRLGLEWARVEPHEGEIDETALDRYGEMLVGCAERGLEPLVTLHHFTHPAWLGEDFWLSSDSPGRFADWVRLVVGRLRGRCRLWVTLNEINVYGAASYMLGIYPPGRRRSTAQASTATAHMLAAHVRAYELIHELQPDAVVFTNNSSSSLYESDRLLTDLLLSRSLGVARDDLPGWLREQRSAWYAAIAAPRRLERSLRRFSAVQAPIARLPLSGLHPARSDQEDPEGAMRPAIEAVYDGDYERPLDVLALDYYDPVVSNHIRLPGRRTAGGRSLAPASDPWDDVVDPRGLETYLRANLAPSGARLLELWIVENGLCNRVRRGRSYERLDGWDRPRYLRENLAAVVRALDAGLPVGAYMHWSLADNYEWGSYEPRFGIHGVDRERGARLLDADAMGRDAAGAYRRLIEALRSGDRSSLGPAA